MAATTVRLLLADDDHDDCWLFKDALKELQVTADLTIVHNGEDLMRYLTAEKNELPHALFLDLNMPRKNGFECLSEIRDNRTWKNLPVIIISTSFDPVTGNQLYASGAQYFIRKPNEFTQLKKLISKVISSITGPGPLKTSPENFLL
ncbi:MAG: response regulator [Bacteroidota bacterium]